MFHNNFWSNVELDLATGQFVEKENLLPTRESLYRMTDRSEAQVGWVASAAYLLDEAA